MKTYCFLNKFWSLAVALWVVSIDLSAQNADRVSLSNEALSIEWTKSDKGYSMTSIRIGNKQKGINVEPAKYQHGVLYSPTAINAAQPKLYDKRGREITIPEAEYRYILPSWRQNTDAVAMNTAGVSILFNPTSVKQVSDSQISLLYEDSLMQVTENWILSQEHLGDIGVTMVVKPKIAGYYSLRTPSISTTDKGNFGWATVPGIFQGDAINDNFARAYGYGQGVPSIPIVTRERTASTLTSIVTDANGVTIAVTAEPGTGRDPWREQTKTHADWRLGLSVMNREGELTPTLYHPILGQKESYIQAGEQISFSFRYTLRNADWYSVLKHAINDIYCFPDFLRLKQTQHSLTSRLYDMYHYLVSDSTSKWRTESYDTMVIGAQEYLGGVHGSERDAMKNSDYGAMWMMAKMTADTHLSIDRLPYALNFKLAQQSRNGGFFGGAAAGQYYLSKSHKFTEEWGLYTEPIATTYYMLMDMGNILLFEPNHKELKRALGSAADRLLSWMKPDGRWEVAYDNNSAKPIFEDIQDLRPTFYGLLVAYKILGDKKYLDAAVKGANWYIDNGVMHGHFLGVCGDTRFVPDFATIQSVQALLELYELTKEQKHIDAALFASRIYTASIYTHPIPTTDIKGVRGNKRADWEISQVGLSFEHGGTMGSANHRGPILLASHAGLFVRLASITGDSLYLNMARAAAIGRDAFVDKSTGVASYYWDSMNSGPGGFPHHAWWQVGWITDYLMAEAELRSNGKIIFPAGFITPKVGPHRAYGFASGELFGAKADLIMRTALITIDNPYIEYITANNDKSKELYIILLNNDDEHQQFNIATDMSKLTSGKDTHINSAQLVLSCGKSKQIESSGNWRQTISAYGLSVIKIKY